MKKYHFTASRDAVNIDYETIIEATQGTGFWDLYELAEKHGCDFFTLDEITE